eukprot:GHVH01001040.1.p1 GENE.GHVH01001040.1~~GHVH01001040.1.p1  ORF type:complete len:1511 (+),score=238.46 GHVH01001040.1:80-4534(+)
MSEPELSTPQEADFERFESVMSTVPEMTQPSDLDDNVVQDSLEIQASGEESSSEVCSVKKEEEGRPDPRLMSRGSSEVCSVKKEEEAALRVNLETQQDRATSSHRSAGHYLEQIEVDNPLKEISSLKESLKTLMEAAALMNVHSAPNVSNYIPRSLFVIGGTGYIGRYITGNLLAMTPSTTKIHCLVRANTPMSGRERMKLALSQAGLWCASFEERLVVYCGDLMQPIMGIPSVKFRYLADLIDGVVCAAGVAPLKFYGSAKDDTTVYSKAPREYLLAFHSVLTFVTTGRVKPLHIVSSLMVNRSLLSMKRSSVNVTEEEFDIDGLWMNSTLPFKDSASGGALWGNIALEEVLRYAIQLDLPIRIYRLPPLFIGNYSGDPHSIFTRLLQLMILSRCAPVRKDSTIPFPLFSSDTTCQRVARIITAPAAVVKHNAYHCVPLIDDATPLFCPSVDDLNGFIREYGLYGDRINEPYLAAVSWSEFKHRCNDILTSGWSINTTLLRRLRDVFSPFSEGLIDIWFDEEGPDLPLDATNRGSLTVSNFHVRDVMAKSEHYFNSLKNNGIGLNLMDSVKDVIGLKEGPITGRESYLYLPWPHARSTFHHGITVALTTLTELITPYRTKPQTSLGDKSLRCLATRKVTSLFSTIANTIHQKLVTHIEDIENGKVNRKVDIREMRFWYGMTDQCSLKNPIERLSGFGENVDKDAADPILQKLYSAKLDMWKEYLPDENHPMLEVAISGFIQLYSCFLLESKQSIVRESILFRMMSSSAININCFLRWDYERCWRLNSLLKAKRTQSEFPDWQPEDGASTPSTVPLLGNQRLNPYGILKKEEMVERIADRPLFVTSPDAELSHYASVLLGMDSIRHIVPCYSEMLSPCTFSRDGWPEPFESYMPVEEAMERNRDGAHSRIRTEEGYGGSLWGGRKGTVTGGYASAVDASTIWGPYLSAIDGQDPPLRQYLPNLHDSRSLQCESSYQRRAAIGGCSLLSGHKLCGNLNDGNLRALESLRDEILPITNLLDLLGRSPTFYDWLYVPSYQKWLLSDDCTRIKEVIPYIRHFIKFIIWSRVMIDAKDDGSPTRPSTDTPLPRLVLNYPQSLWGSLSAFLDTSFPLADIASIHCPPQWSLKGCWERLSLSSWLMSEAYERGLKAQLEDHPNVLMLRSLKTQEVLNMNSVGNTEESFVPNVQLKTPLASGFERAHQETPLEGSEIDDEVLTTSEFRQLVQCTAQPHTENNERDMTMILDRTFANACEELLRVRVKAAVTQGYEEYLQVRSSYSTMRHMNLRKNASFGIDDDESLSGVQSPRSNDFDCPRKSLFIDIHARDLLEDPTTALAQFWNASDIGPTQPSGWMELMIASRRTNPLNLSTQVNEAISGVFKENVLSQVYNQMMVHANGKLKALVKRHDKAPSGFPPPLSTYHPHEFEQYCNRFCPRRVPTSGPPTLMRSVTTSLQSTLAAVGTTRDNQSNRGFVSGFLRSFGLEKKV